VADLWVRCTRTGGNTTVGQPNEQSTCQGPGQFAIISAVGMKVTGI
jgi:hypothetical protein